MFELSIQQSDNFFNQDDVLISYKQLKRKKDLSKSASDLILQTSGFTFSDMGKQDPAKVERIKKLQADNKLYLLSSPIEDLSPSDKRQRRK